MIKFLLKGILRDRSRSLLPILIIAIGVGLTVILSGYLKGAFGDIIDQNARFSTGHVKVMSQAYSENVDQIPNDLALLEAAQWMDTLRTSFPEMQWIQRIKFGGMIDVPDSTGNTKAQGPATGLALDLFTEESGENKRMNLQTSLVTGQLPEVSGQAIIGHNFAEKLSLEIGDEITLFGSTMYGSMTFQTFAISGTIRFGTAAMDKGALLIDIRDAQQLLDMNNATGEILGYLKSGVYDQPTIGEITATFNAAYTKDDDEFSPVMLSLREQNNLESLLDYSNVMSGIFIFVFVDI